MKHLHVKIVRREQTYHEEGRKKWGWGRRLGQRERPTKRNEVDCLYGHSA